MRLKLIGIIIFVLGCNQVSGVKDFTFKDPNEQKNGDAGTPSVDTEKETGEEETQGEDTRQTDNENTDQETESTDTTPKDPDTGSEPTTTDSPGSDTVPGTDPTPTDEPGSDTVFGTDPVTTDEPGSDTIFGTDPLTTDSNESDSEPVEDTGFEMPPNPFEGIDCETQDTMKCEYYICSPKETVETTNKTCEQYAGVVDGYDKYCEDFLGCYADYVQCYAVTCPPGGSVMDRDPDKAAECSDTLNSCVSTLSYPAM